jgi:putative glutamine amidotransferase
MKPVIGITASIDNDSFKVKRAYISAVADSGALPVILPVSGCAEECADIIDGLLLTGGGDIPPDYYGGDILAAAPGFRPEKRERTDFELALLARTLEKSKPALATCYGMQLLNVFFGGSLIGDIAGLGKGYSDHKNVMHGIRVSGGLAGCEEGVYTVNSTHHQAVDRVGAGLDVFAVSDDGLIEGLFKRDYNFCVGVQWHPERIFIEPLSEWLFKSLTGRADDIRRLR